MKKHWIISIALTCLICLSGISGILIIKNKANTSLQDEPRLLLNTTKEVNFKEVKEIIRDTQKKVVMIEMPDGSIGSGFLYNDKGDVLTNAHVVSGVKDVKIRTTDAKGFDGKVIGISSNIDVAVVRVEGLKDLEPLEISHSHQVEIGDEILALGSPLGLQNTVTTGIISGTGREFDLPPYKYENAYQISAQIAPGNSGGPLLDRKTGKVIGINSAIMNGGSIGFSIPIQEVFPLAKTWSETPMETLPDISGLDGYIEINETKKLETADYLVSYYLESIDYQDYVTAYSLLGSNWQSKVGYEDFRNQYVHIASLKIEDILTEEAKGIFIVKVKISTEEIDNGNKENKKYHITYQVDFENDEAKILSEHKEEIIN